jgi:hypothetical protein
LGKSLDMKERNDQMSAKNIGLRLAAGATAPADGNCPHKTADTSAPTTGAT